MSLIISDVFEELKMPTLTTKYTKVYVEKEYKYNAKHRFIVARAEDGEKIADIHFQEGPIKECGVNGVANEDLLNMVLCRLKHFQDSPYKCNENQAAIEHIEGALRWLRARTNKRAEEGKEGTSQV